MLKTPKKSFDILDKYIKELYKKYLKKHIDNLTSPDEYDFDVKAFCILSHAAFEGYIEELALYAIKWSMDKYESKRQITRPLLMLSVYYGNRSEISDVINRFDNWNSERCHDILRKCKDKLKLLHSKSIHINHGFSMKYCVETLFPVAIDVPLDLRLTSAVQDLADYRGKYAHSHVDDNHIGLIKSASPNDINNIVKDCLEFCKFIKTSTYSACKVFR